MAQSLSRQHYYIDTLAQQKYIFYLVSLMAYKLIEFEESLAIFQWSKMY